MGSPLGPFLANVFMGKVEKTRLQDAINDLVFYGRYVDDIFCLADGTTDIDDLVQNFNSAHPSLKFTTQAEQLPGNRLFAFLCKLSEGLHPLLAFVKEADKLVVLGDFNVRSGIDQAAWEEMLGPCDIRGCNENSLLL
nr:unnamed protein product [Spirometra erinaceieuropaei]